MIKPFYVMLLCAWAITACTQRPDTISFADPVASASIQHIYVATTRLPQSTPIDFKEDRNLNSQYRQFDVSIPSTHQLGQIEWPKGIVDPKTDFAVVGVKDYANSNGFVTSLNAQTGDEVAVYVHGFNNTASEALYRFAQISQDFEITTPRVLFAWPSSGRATGYVYDRDSVLFSRDPLADLLTQISRKTNKKITLMAHSMGAHLTMEVLRQLAISGRRDVLNDMQVVVLLSPDIDPDVFRRQANAIGRLPDPFVIMTNRDDRALKLSKFINIGRQKVGDLSRAKDVAGLNVTLFDFSTLADGSNLDHLVPLTSPTAITVLRDLVKSDRRGQLDLSNFEIGEDGVIRTRRREEVSINLPDITL